MQKVDFNSWRRLTHYNTFKDIYIPQFSICSRIDVTNLVNTKVNFFNAFLFKIMKASNQVNEFKYRIVNGDVFKFEHLDVNFNLLADNNCFVSKRLSYEENYDLFSSKLQSIKDNVPMLGELKIDPSEDMGLVITSYLPWMDIQSINEPIFNKDESFIKIVYGKYEQVGDKYYLSMSVRAHHGLVDGVHIGQFFNLLQKSIKEIQ